MVVDCQPRSETQGDIKILLVGDPFVGKTTTLQKYGNSEEEGTETKVTTITKLILIDGKQIQLTICEVGSQLTSTHLLEAQGVIVMYDVTNPTTYKGAQDWVSRINSTPGALLRFVLAGNKADIPPSEQLVGVAEVDEYVHKIGAKHFRVSALNNTNIDAMFWSIVNWIRQTSSAASDEYCSTAPLLMQQREADYGFCTCIDCGCTTDFCVEHCVGAGSNRHGCCGECSYDCGCCACGDTGCNCSGCDCSGVDCGGDCGDCDCF